MVEVKNSILLETVLKALYNVTSRRTSSKYADETIGSTIKTLESKFEFMKYVDIVKPEISDEGFAISISSDIERVRPELIGKAIEALVRVVYNDISSEVGLYFITELKEHAGDEITRMILKSEVDLDQIQFEQHYAFRRREKKKSIKEAAMMGTFSKRRPENLLGYGWDNVSHWKHEPGSKYCTLYTKEGKVLDRLNLDRIIQNYVEKLSGYIDVNVREIEKEAQVYEKEYSLLQLLLEQDMDAEAALHKLKITREELNNMIRKLSQMEMLQYVDFNTVELTDVGIGYLSKKEKIKQ
jgi:hypothetical protein